MDVDVLSEPELRARAKDIKALFRDLHRCETTGLSNIDALAEHRLLLERLFATAECQQISSTHRAAACNALCVYLEQGFASTVADLRNHTLGLTAWDRLLSLYLERIQDPGSKPMKQTLDTLRKGLAASTYRNPTDQEKTRVALSRCLTYIASQDNIACIKPAMNVLVVLLSKGFASLEQLDFAIEAVLSRDAVADVTSPGSPSVWVLMMHTLRWAQLLDIAPTAGKLLSVLLGTLKASSLRSAAAKIVGLASYGWIDVLMRFAQDDQSKMEILERYILPPLLQVDEDDTAQFLQSLAYDELMDGSFCHISEEQARLCLLTVKVILQSMPTILTGKSVSYVWLCVHQS